MVAVPFASGVRVTVTCDVRSGVVIQCQLLIGFDDIIGAADIVNFAVLSGFLEPDAKIATDPDIKMGIHHFAVMGRPPLRKFLPIGPCGKNGCGRSGKATPDRQAWFLSFHYGAFDAFGWGDLADLADLAGSDVVSASGAASTKAASRSRRSDQKCS